MSTKPTSKLWTDKSLLASWKDAEGRGECMGEWCKNNKLPIYTTVPRVHELLIAEKVGQKPRCPFDVVNIPLRWDFNWHSFMVVGDVQIPTTDWNLCSMVSYVARKRMKPPRHLIIDGDFLNFDAWSVYPNSITPPSWKDEKAAGKLVLDEWLNTFDEIYWLLGNHERRRLKAMDAVEDEDDLLNVLAVNDRTRVKVSVLDRMSVNTPNGKWVICHGGDYAQGLLVKADLYAQKYQAHVIAGHCHRFGMGIDRYNRYCIVALGGLFDQSKMAYAEIMSTSKPEMSQGFVLINDGYPEGYSPLMTNWDVV